MARSTQRKVVQPGSGKPRWPHQQQTVRFLLDNPRVFDNSDPGTGKTRSQVEAYSARPKPRGRMLVLCPKTLMIAAWGADLEKFAPELTVSYAFAEQREAAFKMPTDVVVMNHDGVKWLTESKAHEKYLLDFDHLVIDEYSAFKHGTSKRSKALAKIRKYFDYRYLMSGTPNPNSVMELWHPCLVLDDGKRLGNSYFHLRSKVQVPAQIGPRPEHLRWDDHPGAAQAVNELLGDITIRHAFEDVMTHVPANHREIKEFALPPKARKAYEKMETDLILALEESVVTAVHAASLRTKLLQIASGAVYNGDGEGSYTLVEAGRYEMIADLVEERQHSVVFFNWRHQRDLLCKHFDSRGITFALIDGSVPQAERDDIVQAYQAGKYQTLLLHPRTGAHGLTLTRGTATIISSPIYEADLLKQAMHRIYRGEQTQITNTICVQAKGTVEDIVYARLFDKEARMGDLLQMMRDRTKQQ